NMFVKFLVEEQLSNETNEKIIEKLPNVDKKVGIDLGLKDFLVLSDGTKIEYSTKTKSNF
ncbi:MAG: transposase, partial [Candidatus Diapherotrites archaeon]|nr:transposase [Candidatus Diapherotrites archaeon]